MALDKKHKEELQLLSSFLFDVNKSCSVEQISLQDTEVLLDQIPFITYVLFLSERDEKECIYFSDKISDSIGLNAVDMLGSGFLTQCLSLPERINALKELDAGIESGQGNIEHKITVSDEETGWVQDSHETLVIDGKKRFLIGHWSDISHLKNHESSSSLKLDSLTGLLNRESIRIKLAELTRLDEKESQHLLCYIDIDQFKIINNTHGVSAGDELLRQISEMLKNCLSRSDILSRLERDVFVILLKDCMLEDANKILVRIQDSFREFRFRWQAERLAVTVSIGVIPANINHAESTADVLLLAENLCKIAKQKGGDRVEIFSDDELLSSVSKIQEEMKWVERINAALEEDRFYLYYQPIVSLNPEIDEKHYELLIRMKDDKGNLVPPGLFLPAAEKYNLSVKIDRWVIQTALSWLEAYSDFLGPNISWGINLSGQSLADADLRRFVLEQFERKKVLHNMVYFEVTETAAIHNLDNAVEFMRALHEKGCESALDDFGSGLSSFAYLKKMPVDYIKIDGMFIKNIIDNEVDSSMVRAIKDISIAMGKKTIAEYVENDEIMEKLKEIGVDFAQGYGIARPQPLSEFATIEGIYDEDKSSKRRLRSVR